MRSRILAIFGLLVAGAFGQSVDITGWMDVPWDTPKSAVLNPSRSPAARECNSSDRPPCAASGGETLVIENYVFVQVAFRVHLAFLPKSGLSKAAMIAPARRDAFEKVLAALTNRYGRPGMQSEYDGDAEQTRTIWTWAKPHGKVSLDSDEASGTFTILYEPRR